RETSDGCIVSPGRTGNVSCRVFPTKTRPHTLPVRLKDTREIAISRKFMAATATVQAMCNLLAKNRLLGVDEVRAIYQKWMSEAENPEDSEAFRRYLVARGHTTEYQAALLFHGRTGGYYID